MALGSSAATWKIVVGHHTIRSLGRHGDTPELVEHVLPILEVTLSLFSVFPYITIVTFDCLTGFLLEPRPIPAES